LRSYQSVEIIGIIVLQFCDTLRTCIEKIKKVEY
jgi:hypothetical protein